MNFMTATIHDSDGHEISEDQASTPAARWLGWTTGRKDFSEDSVGPEAGQADPAAIKGTNSQTGNRWEMWSESVLLFLFVEGNVTIPDFRCDLEN